MNKVILIGRLASDPETRTTQGGHACCTFRLAVNRRYKNPDGNREADFINIVAWRQTAELCARYLSKGRQAAIEGSLQTRAYDAQDGSKRYVTEVIADNVEFIGDNSKAQMEPEKPSQGNFAEVDDDELPF